MSEAISERVRTWHEVLKRSTCLVIDPFVAFCVSDFTLEIRSAVPWDCSEDGTKHYHLPHRFEYSLQDTRERLCREDAASIVGGDRALEKYERAARLVMGHENAPTKRMLVWERGVGSVRRYA